MKIRNVFSGILLLLCIYLSIKGNAQASLGAAKTVIDSNCFGRWPSILGSSMVISNDGKYSAYLIIPGHSDYITEIKQASKSSLSIASNSTGWKIDIVGAGPAGFSNDSRQVYFMKENNSLGILDTKIKVLSYVPNVSRFELAEDGDWMVYSSKTPKDQLTLKNTTAGKTLVYSGVTGYQFSKDGKVLILTTKMSDKNILTWIELATSKTIKIWEGGFVSQLTFNHSSSGVAFITSENQANLTAFTIYRYSRGMESAQLLTDNRSPGLNNEFMIANARLLFSKKDDRILFRMDTLKQPVNQNLLPKYKNIAIWSYRDSLTQAVQHTFPNIGQTTYNAVVNLNDKKIIRVNHEGEALDWPPSFEDQLVIYKETFGDRYIVRKNNQLTYYLISTQSGERKTVIDNTALYDNCHLSPDEHYVIRYNDDSLAYFSYEVATGITRNISRTVPASLFDQAEAAAGKTGSAYGIAGWSENGHCIYLYDHWDIWKVDLAGLGRPLKITSGNGKKVALVFGIVNLNNNNIPVIKTKDDLLLTVFDPKAKDNGFYKLKSGFNSIPERLSIGHDAEYISRTGDFGHVEVTGTRPIRARNSQTYLVTRQRADIFPNLYVTHDFKSFEPISDLHPSNDYNWLTSELITWTMPNGRNSQGILYKPENLDPNKKYSVIFVYYEEENDDLNAFLKPDWTGDDLNIPYFVSNGYLVVRPDIIFYKKYHDGQEIINSVVSGAKFLSKLPFVDSTKMGINGHRYGGWETNYLVTHTHLFTVAATASGPSDEITNYYEDSGWKGSPPPAWMTKGVPLSMKGKDNGLKPDLSGAKP